MPLTHLPSETLAQISKLAELLYAPAEIADAMQLSRCDVAMAMQDERSPFRVAYNEGYYKSDVTLRSAILKLAKDGSSPAQALALKMKEQLDYKSFYG